MGFMIQHERNSSGLAFYALFFGHPLLDIVTESSAELLKAYDICEGSVNLAEPSQMPVFKILLNSETSLYSAGGSAMNTARTMKWVCPEIDAGFVGAIGCDQFCNILTRSLDTAGVEHLFEYSDAFPTGTCASLVVKNERALLANLGAATQLTLEHMRSVKVESAIKRATLFYAEGFFLNTVSSPENIMLVARHALREKKLFCFNLSAPYVSQSFGDRLKLILPYVDILFGCRDDFAAFGDMMWGEECRDNIEETLMRLVRYSKENELRPRLVVCTCGGTKTSVASEGGVIDYPVMPVDEQRIVDTTGAGDAFTGGFLAQYIHNPNIDYCVEAGHASASVVIRHWGASLNGDPPQLKK